jgi:hypothetical protein
MYMTLKLSKSKKTLPRFRKSLITYTTNRGTVQDYSVLNPKLSIYILSKIEQIKLHIYG